MSRVMPEDNTGNPSKLTVVLYEADRQRLKDLWMFAMQDQPPEVNLNRSDIVRACIKLAWDKLHEESNGKPA